MSFTKLVVKHKVADTLSRLRTDGKDTAYWDHDLPVCNVESIQVTTDIKRYVHACMECDVENDLLASKTGEDPIKKREN